LSAHSPKKKKNVARVGCVQFSSFVEIHSKDLPEIDVLDERTFSLKDIF
jgi:hypothetical protein